MKYRREMKPETGSGQQQGERPKRQPSQQQPEQWRDGAKAIVYGVDRLTIWFNASSISGLRKCLDLFCAKYQIHVMSMFGNAMWKMKAEVNQPKFTLYMALQACLDGRVLVLITYVEFAVDVIVKQKSKAVLWKHQFVAHAVVPYMRDGVEEFKGTSYYARRTTKGGRRGHVLVAYADKPSKLESRYLGKPALHIEWRTAGSAALSKAGVVTLADLRDFDHRAFWARKLRLYCVGEVMRAADIGVARFKKLRERSVQRAGQDAFPKVFLSGHFCMQNFVRAKPSVVRSLKFRELATWIHQLPVQDHVDKWVDMVGGAMNGY